MSFLGDDKVKSNVLAERVSIEELGEMWRGAVEEATAPKTNKEWLSTLPSDLLYDVLDWLMHQYGRNFTDSRIGVIEWLNKEHDISPLEKKLYGRPI